MQDNNRQQFVFPEPMRIAYRENIRKTILKNGWDMSRLDTLPEATLDKLMLKYGYRKAAEMIGEPKQWEKKMNAERNEYRQAIRKIILKMGGDVSKFDSVSDSSLFGYYASQYHTKEDVARAIIEFDWGKYWEIIRQEVIKQGGDPSIMDQYVGDGLRFYRDTYKTNEMVATACIHCYR